MSPAIDHPDTLVVEKNTSDRYVSIWFQVTITNLYARRQIIDTKAGLMITVNSIILSVLIGSLYPRLQEDPQLLWGLGPIVIADVLSIIFAVLATRPIIAKGKFSREDVQNKNACLNTFDDFYRMSEVDYQWAVSEMVKDTQAIQNSYTKENYRVGIDLAKRYKRMRISYHIFLTGLIMSVVGFAICYLFLF